MYSVSYNLILNDHTAHFFPPPLIMNEEVKEVNYRKKQFIYLDFLIKGRATYMGWHGINCF